MPLEQTNPSEERGGESYFCGRSTVGRHPSPEGRQIYEMSLAEVLALRLRPLNRVSLKRKTEMGKKTIWVESGPGASSTVAHTREKSGAFRAKKMSIWAWRLELLRKRMGNCWAIRTLRRNKKSRVVAKNDETGPNPHHPPDPRHPTPPRTTPIYPTKLTRPNPSEPTSYLQTPHPPRTLAEKRKNQSKAENDFGQ